MTKLDIAGLEETWEDYKNSDKLNYLGRLNLAAWMGKRMGPVLEEIERLRAEIAQCHIYLDESYVNDPEEAEALPLLERVVDIVGQLYKAQAECQEFGV